MINSILNHAVKWQFLSFNPNAKIDRPKIVKKEACYYNLEQVKKLINCLDNECSKYKALILLAIDTGARRGEIAGLEWEFVSFDSAYIIINKTTQYLNNKTVIEKLPKNDSSIRKVPITKATVEALAVYKEEQKNLKEKLGNKWSNSNKVFTTFDGKDMFPDTPSKSLTKILKKNNLSYINFHALRHTSVSLLIASGIHTQVISKRVGHSSASTTQNIYIHVFESVADEVTEKLNNIFAQ